MTDHKPLQTIYSPTSKPSARIERWVLRLQPFTFRVRYVPGPQNIADALSRLPANHLPADYTGETATEEYVYTMTTLSAPAAVSIRDMERASANDTELQFVRQFVKTGDAAHLPRPYLPLRYELTTIGQVVFRGTRIVPPASLRRPDPATRTRRPPRNRKTERATPHEGLVARHRPLCRAAVQSLHRLPSCQSPDGAAASEVDTPPSTSVGTPRN